MTDIVEALRERAFQGRYNIEAADEIERLRDELDACQKDAERYRWLRHGDNYKHMFSYSGNDDAVLFRNEELDAAIDAAMKGQS